MTITSLVRNVNAGSGEMLLGTELIRWFAEVLSKRPKRRSDFIRIVVGEYRRIWRSSQHHVDAVGVTGKLLSL